MFSGQQQALDEIVKSAFILSKKKIGALIAIEREIGLRPYIESGVKMDSHVTSELLNTIFTPNTPLHDGGIVVQGSIIAAAGCLFPTVKVGLFQSKKIIVDGVHRVRSHEFNKVKYISCSELPFENRTELFAEAVRLNARHGKSFTEKELKASIRRLQKFKFSGKDIQKITSIPAADIHREIAAPIISLRTPSGKHCRIQNRKCNGEPNVRELIQFKNALQLIRDVARKRCIPSDDPYFKTLIKQCREALQKVKFNV